MFPIRKLPVRWLPLFAFLCLPPLLPAQSSGLDRFELYGGYAFLSNTINGVPGSQQSLNGWVAEFAVPPWHNLRFKFDVSGYSGTNLGALQKPYSITGGGQYTWHLRKESLFAEAMFGTAGINRYWGPNQLPGDTASFISILGGGVDTPVAPHFAIRLAADYQWTNFSLIQSVSDAVPYTYPGIPRYFARITAGPVWRF